MNLSALRFLLLPVVLLPLMLLPGCRSTAEQHTPVIGYGRSVSNSNTIVVVATRVSDTSVLLRCVIPARTGKDNDPITSLTVARRNTSGTADTLYRSPEIKSADMADSLKYVVCETRWSSRELRFISTFDAEVSQTSKHGAVTFVNHVEIIDSTPIALYPTIVRSSDTLVIFRCPALRITRPAREYLPSSESFRIRILDESGQRVWSSDEGMAFLARVSPVEPQVPGQVFTYEMPWICRTTSGSRIKPGTYTAEFIIPSRPQAYANRITFVWPLQ